jgi:hypothetical protein
MQTPFAAWFPLEVLDGIGDVDSRASKARLLEKLIEQAPCRADERMAAKVLLIAGLLTDQHDASVARTLAVHSLGGTLPEIAPTTVGRCLARRGRSQLRQTHGLFRPRRETRVHGGAC